MEPNTQLLGEFKHLTRSVWAADGTLDHVEVLLPSAPAEGGLGLARPVSQREACGDERGYVV